MAKKITITRLATMRNIWLSSAKRLPRNSGMVSESSYCSVCARRRGATSTQFAQAPRNSPSATKLSESQIERATGGERGGRQVSIRVSADSLNKKKTITAIKVKYKYI